MAIVQVGPTFCSMYSLLKMGNTLLLLECLSDSPRAFVFERLQKLVPPLCNLQPIEDHKTKTCQILPAEFQVQSCVLWFFSTRNFVISKKTWGRLRPQKMDGIQHEDEDSVLCQASFYHVLDHPWSNYFRFEHL